MVAAAESLRRQVFSTVLLINPCICNHYCLICNEYLVHAGGCVLFWNSFMGDLDWWGTVCKYALWCYHRYVSTTPIQPFVCLSAFIHFSNVLFPRTSAIIHLMRKEAIKIQFFISSCPHRLKYLSCWVLHLTSIICCEKAVLSITPSGLQYLKIVTRIGESWWNNVGLPILMPAPHSPRSLTGYEPCHQCFSPEDRLRWTDDVL